MFQKYALETQELNSIIVCINIYRCFTEFSFFHGNGIEGYRACTSLCEQTVLSFFKNIFITVVSMILSICGSLFCRLGPVFFVS